MAQQEIYRNPDGTFGKGTVANPAGRPRREVEETTLATICDYETPERVKQIIEAMHIAATKFQNVQAARLILDYIAGKPPERLAISRGADDVLGDLSDAQIDEILASSSHGPSGNGATGGDDGTA